MPIKSTKQLIIFGSLGLAFALTLLPHVAGAWWPFYTNADAAANSIVPSSATPALVATTNLNPDAAATHDIQTSGDVALISYSGPSGTLADVEDAVPSDRISIYVVRTGDSLSDIAKMFKVSVNTIIWANNLKSASDIHPGDTLVILPISGVKRTIIKGDTLKNIANKYGADANEIAQFNGLDQEAKLVVGSEIIIPNGEITPATPTPKKTTARSSAGGLYHGGGAAQNGYYSNPVPGARVTQGLHGHNGIDFGATRGTPIRAAASGTVIVSRNGGWNGGYGVYVVITHPNGTQTLYSHMTNAIVSQGQSVSQGQVIGYAGSTGKSTGVHLHFEVRGAVNPFAR